MGRSGRRGIYLGGGLIAALGLAMLLTACGGAASANSGGTASAGATATCPPTATGNFKVATGTLSAVSSNAITVTDAKGSQTIFTLNSSTRVTKVVSEPPSALTAGTSVQVMTDTNVTTAQRITILGQGAAGQGRGGFPGFGGGRNGTPPAGANRSCFSRGTPGAGAPGGQASGFQGLRGTVASASSTQLVLDDAQGQTFSMAITSSTQITSTKSGATSDLTMGARVMVTGSKSGNSFTARSIIVQQAASQ